MSYHRKREENRRLKKLYDETKSGYVAGAWYDENKKRFIRYSCNNKWHKEHCRRMIRRKLKRTFRNYSGCTYKKMYDYWWEVA